METKNAWLANNESQKMWLKKWNHEFKNCEECQKTSKCTLLDRLYGNCKNRIEQNGH